MNRLFEKISCHKWTAVMVVLLLICHFLLGFFSMRQKSATFDEPVFMAGAAYLDLKHDYRINPEGGIIPQALSGVPLLFKSDIKIPDENVTAILEFNQQVRARELINKNADYDSLLIMSRTMLLLLSCIGGLAIFLIGCRIWGRTGGVIAMTLYCLSPAVIANGRLVVADLPLAIFFMLALWSCSRLFRRITIGNFIFAVLSVLGVILAKMPGIVIVPVFFVMLIMSLWFNHRVEVNLLSLNRNIHRAGARLGTLCVVAFAGILCVYVLLWGVYGFRYSMNPDGSNAKEVALMEKSWQVQLKSCKQRDYVQFAREYKLLPEAYLYGMTQILIGSGPRKSYLLREVYTTGKWYYFPLVMLMKMPLPLLILLALSAVVAVKCVAGPRTGFRRKKLFRYAALLYPFAGFGIFYLAVAMSKGLNIGIRHILPVYPCLFICGGILGLAFSRSKWMRLTVVGLLCWLAGCCLWTFPDYLSYINICWGGQRNARNLLADSAVDWGQDLPPLNQVLKRYPEQNVYLAYFGNVPPERYLERKFEYLTTLFQYNKRRADKYEPGVYCLSISSLWNILGPEREVESQERREFFQFLKAERSRYMAAGEARRKELVRKHGSDYWNRVLYQYDLYRYLRLCSYLRSKKPDDFGGRSILIFRLDSNDIAKILN